MWTHTLYRNLNINLSVYSFETRNTFLLFIELATENTIIFRLRIFRFLEISFKKRSMASFLFKFFFRKTLILKFLPVRFAFWVIKEQMIQQVTAKFHMMQLENGLISTDIPSLYCKFAQKFIAQLSVTKLSCKEPDLIKHFPASCHSVSSRCISWQREYAHKTSGFVKFSEARKFATKTVFIPRGSRNGAL